MTSTSSISWTRGLVAIAILLSTLQTLVLADRECACQPTSYDITIKTSLDCIDSTVGGLGIKSNECSVRSRLSANADVMDLVPRMITEVQVLELSESGKILDHSVYNMGPYSDGDVIQYTSVLERVPDAKYEGTSMPRELQVVISAVTADNKPIQNSWGIKFSHECTRVPMIRINDKIGWTVLVSDVPRLDQTVICHSRFYALCRVTLVYNQKSTASSK